MANLWTRIEHERLIQRLFLTADTTKTDRRPCGCFRDPLVFSHGDGCLNVEHTAIQTAIDSETCGYLMANWGECAKAPGHKGRHSLRASH